MCSARAEPEVPTAGDDGRERLIRAAMELVGERGHKAATVRAVSKRAGLSPPLVMYHFGSKDGLLVACDEYVRDLVERALATVTNGEMSEATLRALLALPDTTEALAYIGRSMFEGGEIGTWWFDEMMRLTLDGLAAAQAAGLARPSDDPEMRAVLLISMDIGALLMRTLVEQRLGASLSDPETVERWVRTEFDLLTHGVLQTGDAADQEHTRTPRGDES